MIYSPIPSKYLLHDELTEILRNLKIFYIVLDKYDTMRESLSEELLDCNNDGLAYETGQCINMFSAHIKYITHNAAIITKLICEEEQITLEECMDKMVDLWVDFKIENADKLLQLPNKLVKDLEERISKRYSNLKMIPIYKEIDGSCPNY